MWSCALLVAFGLTAAVAGGAGGSPALVVDLNPGAASSIDSCFDCAFPVGLGATLLYRANDGTHGRQVWKSDGTSGGTASRQRSTA